MTTAAAIIIGDEILSGKVDELNTRPLVKMLSELGVELWRVSFIGDSLRDIMDEVRFCHNRCDVVITSGGIGPTHDDRTMEGVALALQVPLLRHPEIEGMIRRHWRGRVTEAALSMADVPQGSRLITGDDNLLPIVVVQRIYLLPGIPELFTAKLELLAGQLEGRRKVRSNLYLSIDESSVAAHLAQVDLECEGVCIGSYPRFGEPDYTLWITIEGAEAEAVESAVSQLLQLIPPEHVVRIET